MKIRSDFVSNSSSASFVVNSGEGDVVLLAQKMGETFTNVGTPWDYENYVEIKLRTKNKNFKEVWEAFKEEKCEYVPWYEDYRTHAKEMKDPEEMAWDSIKISLDALISMSSCKCLDKIEEIWFESTDENSSECNAHLALMFKFLDSIGCNPDSSVSERNFMDDEDDEFYSIMKKTIKAKGKYTT